MNYLARPQTFARLKSQVLFTLTQNLRFLDFEMNMDKRELKRFDFSILKCVDLYPRTLSFTHYYYYSRSIFSPTDK